jgi:hypothetical protein
MGNNPESRVPLKSKAGLEDLLSSLLSSSLFILRLNRLHYYSTDLRNLPVGLTLKASGCIMNLFDTVHIEPLNLATIESKSGFICTG